MGYGLLRGGRNVSTLTVFFMKALIFFVVTFLLFSGGEVPAQNTETETQIWGITTYEVPLGENEKKLSGVVTSDLRLIDDLGGLRDLRFGFIIKYEANKSISIRPGYVFRVRRLAERNDRFEHRLRFDITPKKDFKNLSLENRNRFEHRIKHSGRNDDTFYRNRTRLRLSIKRNGRTIFTPFVSDDVWFDLQNARIFRNDFSGGVSRKITKNLSADFFYRHRRNFRTGTNNENLFGVQIRLRMKKN